MKKIAFLINSFGGGGAERNIKYLIENLISEYEIHVIVLEELWAYELPQAVKRHLLFNENKFPTILRILTIPYSAFKLKKTAKIHNFNIVISFLTRANLIAGFSKKIGLHTPLIISERLSSYSLYSKGLSGIVGRFLISKLYCYADIIVPNSKRIQFELEHFFSLQVKMKVVYNPVDIQFILSKSCESLTLPVNSERFTFLNVGRLTNQKNQLLLLNAFAHIKNMNCQLLIIGDGPDREFLNTKIHQLGLSNKVYLFPFQNNPYVFMSHADCFVLSSDFEGFPNVVLEALSCSLPVISTDCSSGPREILAPNTSFEVLMNDGMEKAEYGILVPVNNSIMLAKAMQLFYEDSEIKINYKIKSMKRANDFQIKNQIRQFHSIIKGLTEK